MESRYRLGEIIISTAGRDRGKYYLIVDIEDENYLKVADGDKKRIERPKRKNIKHLRSTGYIDEELLIWLSNGKRVRNEDLKKSLRDYEYEEAK